MPFSGSSILKMSAIPHPFTSVSMVTWQGKRQEKNKAEGFLFYFSLCSQRSNVYALRLGFLLHDRKLGTEQMKWALARSLFPSGLPSRNSSARSVAGPTRAQLLFCCLSSLSLRHQQPALKPGRPRKTPCAASLQPGCSEVSSGLKKKEGGGGCSLRCH